MMMKKSSGKKNRMLRKSFILVVLFLCIVPFTLSVEASFTDMERVSWAKDQVEYLADRGTVAGLGGGRFEPGVPITRAQAITYLVREMYPDVTESRGLSFSDVGKSHYFYKEISVGFHKGLIGGYPDHSFRPDAPITRAETAALLLRAYSVQKGSESRQFLDLDEAPWAKEAIWHLSSQGLIGGYPDQTFRPNQNVTRAEFSVFLARIIQFQRAEAIQNKDLEKLMSYMTVQEKIGQMLMPDVRMYGGSNTTKMNAGLENQIRQQHLGGVILFEKNIVSKEQLAKLSAEVQQVRRDIPLFVALDQEGGPVKRIPGGTDLPGNMAIGATRSKELAYQAGAVLGAESKVLGVNVNFAPVLDINSNPMNPIIGNRSFGESAELVSTLGIPLMKGIQDEGVIATVKHFPGHGDTSVDSHLGLPVVQSTRTKLDAVELKPFRDAIAAGTDMIMTAHIMFPELDQTTVTSKKDGTKITLPATLSKEILTGLLRNEMNYDGVIVTDAFTMKAIADHFGEDEAVVKAVQAGADIILMPQNIERSYRALLSAVQNGQVSKATIDESVKRILELKWKKGLFEDQKTKSLEVVGSAKHKEIERKIAEQGVTVLSQHQSDFPFSIGEKKEIVIVAPLEKQANRIKKAVDDLSSSQNVRVYTYDTLARSMDHLQSADLLLLASYDYKDRLYTDRSLLTSIIGKANQENQSYALLSLGNPYDLRLFEDAGNTLALYGDNEANIKAAIQILFGEIPAQGRFPK